MSVLMPNTELAVRKVPDQVGTDEHGAPLPASHGTTSQALPGMVKEQEDGSWLLCLDPELWPMRRGDLVVGDGFTWLVSSLKLCENSLDPSADYIRCVAAQRRPEGTEPGGGQWVGR